MRNTKQRDCIFDIVNSSYNHLNAYQIYDIAKKVIYNISLGTVYRNLAWLSEHNKVRTIVVDGIVRYDRNVVHDHFICNECKNIIDISRNDNSNNYIDGNLLKVYLSTSPFDLTFCLHSIIFAPAFFATSKVLSVQLLTITYTSYLLLG